MTTACAARPARSPLPRRACNWPTSFGATRPLSADVRSPLDAAGGPRAAGDRSVPHAGPGRTRASSADDVRTRRVPLELLPEQALSAVRRLPAARVV